MTIEYKRIKVAEYCGWSARKMISMIDGKTEITLWEKKGELRLYADYPDYPNDLNAMREAVEGLRNNQFHYVAYPEALFKIVTKGIKWDGKNMGYFFFNFSNASCGERFEAFGIAAELWKEGE